MKPAVYTRPAKPLRLAVRRREDFAAPEIKPAPEIVAVDRFTECHVTPPDVAARMVEYLGPRGDYLTLEPSAGTGNLSRALIESGHSKAELVQVERHYKLAGGLYKFGTVIQRCFLEYAAEAAGGVEFPRVIMNPPFSDVRKHIAAALSLMGRNGHDCAPCLVALVPVTFQHDSAEELEQLGPDTFATAKVYTKIIRIYAEAPPRRKMPVIPEGLHPDYVPEKLVIERKRFSTTQGECLLTYDGQRLEQFGDKIKMLESGDYEGLPDSAWHKTASDWLFYRHLMPGWRGYRFNQH